MSGMVLTAAHCVAWSKEGGLSAEVKTFFIDPTYPEGESYPFAIEAWSGSWKRETDSRSGDWAILMLNESPKWRLEGEPRFIPLASAWPQRHESIWLAGFSGDLKAGHSMSYQSHCNIRDVLKDGVFHHDCDAYAGTSGAPVFSYSKTTRSFSILGIHNAHKSKGSAGLKIPNYQRTYANLGTSSLLIVSALKKIVKIKTASLN